MAFAPVFQRPFNATFDRRAAAAAAAGNGLLNSLVAYWALDEAAGANHALDKHTNALTMPQVSSPGAGTGKVYSTARVCTTTAYFERADDALISTGDVDFTIAAWVNFGTINGGHTIVGKYYAGSEKEFALSYSFSLGKFSFIVTADGSTPVEALATTFGAASPGNWYLAIGWHDSVANTINIQVNDGVVDSTAHAGGVRDGTQALRFGFDNWLGGFANGRIGPVAFWKSAAGGGGVLTTAQRTALYNAGAGLAYANFTT